MLRELRESVRAVVDALPNPPSRAIDLARELSLDRSLGWKLHRVAYGEDALPSPQHVPGRRGCEIFLRSVRKRDIEEALVARAAAAFDGFRRLGESLGGDRATGDIVLSEFSQEGHRRRDLALRRALYRANSQLLGVRAVTLKMVTLVLSGGRGMSPIYYQVRALVGFRCLREGATWTLGRMMVVTTPDRRPQTGPLRTPLEPVGEGASPLVGRFCRGTGPMMRRRQVAPGVFEDEIPPATIGEAGERDIVVGERIGSVPAEMIDDAVITNVVMPLERLSIDLHLHRSIATGRRPGVTVFTSVLDPSPWMNTSGRDRLPVDLDVRNLRDVPANDQSARRSRTLFEYLAAAAGLPADEFVGYRVNLRFPPLPCSVMMDYELPPRSDATQDDGSAV